jgi:hypothetical protein
MGVAEGIGTVVGVVGDYLAHSFLEPRITEELEKRRLPADFVTATLVVTGLALPLMVVLYRIGIGYKSDPILSVVYGMVASELIQLLDAIKTQLEL